ARLPRGTGLSPSSRRNCAGKRRNDPNETSFGALPAGSVRFSKNGLSATGVRTSRLASSLGSLLDDTRADADDIDARMVTSHGLGVLFPNKDPHATQFERLGRRLPLCVRTVSFANGRGC